MSRIGIVTCLVVGAVAVASSAFTEPPLADVRYFGTSVEFSPTKWGHGFLLRVVAPDGSVVNKTVSDVAPRFDLSELKGPSVDGRYKYELRLIVSPPRQRGTASYKSIATAKPRVKVPSLNGSFLVSGGSIVSPEEMDSKARSVDLATPQGEPDTPDLTVNEDLYVFGSIGIGNSSPSWELHITDGGAPGVRLEQDSSLGWTPYIWDVVGTESGFFVGDYTAGAYIPFLIEPGAPEYSIFVNSDGKLGFGTPLPTYQFEVKRTGVNSAVVVDRTDGATNYINATASFGNFGTVTNHPLRLIVNGSWQMRINSSSAIQMANGAYLSAGGVWTNASSRALKQDIEGLSIEEATSTLADLEPVKFAFKSNGERHVGFIAEDVPELVAGADRNGLSPMDVVAVLTRIVQEQRKIVAAHQRELQEQREIINELRARIRGPESR